MNSYRNPAAQWLGSPNFEPNRDGHDMAVPPSWVVIHTMVGDVPGANARFQQASQQASAHYGVGYDGGLFQWVDEKDAAYHAGNWGVNLDSIGIEHSDMGRYNDPRPDALYKASAALVRGICQRYGIPIRHGNVPTGTPGIVAHREVTQTACPDALNVDRIIQQAASTPGPPSVPQEETEMIILSDAQNLWYFVSGNMVVQIDPGEPAAQSLSQHMPVCAASGGFIAKLQAASKTLQSAELDQILAGVKALLAAGVPAVSLQPVLDAVAKVQAKLDKDLA